MSKKYDLKVMLRNNGEPVKNENGKNIYMNIGMTLTEKEGRFALYDARTGQTYYAFERQPRQQNAPQQATQEDLSDDIPF